MSTRRLWYFGAVLALLVGSAGPGALSASAAGSRTFKIGVDNASPTGHNFLYVDFFPRESVRIHRGDVVDFSWNTGSPDGAHTVALPPTGGAPLGSFATPDVDDGPQQLMADPAVFAPSDPTCGSSATPCVYNGASRLTSGFAPNAPGNDFFVKMDMPAGTINFYCELHPGMHGSVQVVADAQPASTTGQVDFAAQVQYLRDTLGAFGAERDVESRSVSQRADGKRNLTLTAGTATQFVEVAEMFPRNARAEAGDNVTWVTHTIRDVHTVTFPQGSGSDGVDPLVNVCEASPKDLPSPPATCAPQNTELHINPQPQGSTVISTPTTVGTSGIIASPPAPFPNEFTFSFPKPGIFVYQCRIHDHMVGTLSVQADR